MANNSITYTDLDFDSLKASLKDYLRGNPYFKDYDFEGANINLLLDLLSYNTHKNAFYLNMVMSESFLDSSQLRDSVVSHAKELNYLPISYRSAKARVRVAFTATGESQPYIIQKGATFSTVVKNQSYIFTIAENMSVSSANTSFSFETDIYEGFYIKDQFLFIENEELQRFRLSNKQVDTDSINVVVYEDGSEVGQIYTYADSLLGLNNNSKVYFLQSAGNDYYEIIFGDGILGQQPKINSTVIVDYRVASGSVANGARVFDMNFDPTDNSEMSTFTVTTIENAASGAEKQTTEQIRRYAPRYFATQQRGVSTDDYASLILAEFGSTIQDVNVYGGEQLTPKLYGRVAIALKPIAGDLVPQFIKDQIADYLLKYINIPTRVLIRDPDFFNVEVQTTVQYEVTSTTKTKREVETIIRQTISDFSIENLETFNNDLRYSRFVKAIDDSDSSITSNDTVLRLIKKIVPKTQSNVVMDIQFNNALSSDRNSAVIESSAFSFIDDEGNIHELSKIEDDQSGNLRVYSYVNAQKTIHKNNVGTVDYETGVLALSGLRVSSYANHIALYAKLLNKDIVINKDSILIIEPEDVSVTIKATVS
jgi:hypothetical protein